MKVQKREESLSVVRANKLVPGVLFGKEIEPLSIQMEEKDLSDAIREFGFSKTFKIKIERKTHTVLLREVQRDVMNIHQVLNVKMLKVAKGDTLSANVAINIIGKEAIEKARLVLNIVHDSVEVEYEVGAGVSHIDLDVSKLSVNDSIHVSDLSIPEGLKVVDDTDKLIVTVAEPAQFIEPEEDEEDVVDAPQDPTQVDAIKQKEE